MGVGVQRHAPAVLPPGKTRYPLYSRLGGPQDRSGPVRKISPLPGFNPRTVQPVASRYADYAVAIYIYIYIYIYNGQRKVWSSGGSTHCTCQLTVLSMSVLECCVI